METHNDKATELIKMEEIKNTPFILVNETEKNTFFGVFGPYKVTEEKSTKDEVINELTPITYDNIIKIISCIIHKLNSK